MWIIVRTSSIAEIQMTNKNWRKEHVPRSKKSPIFRNSLITTKYIYVHSGTCILFFFTIVSPECLVSVSGSRGTKKKRKKGKQSGVHHRNIRHVDRIDVSMS